MLLKTVTIMDQIITENISYFNNLTLTNEYFNNLLYIAAECNTELKFSAFKVYIHVVKNTLISELPDDIINQLNMFSSYLEQTVYDVFYGKIQTTHKELNEFFVILSLFLENHLKLLSIKTRVHKISNFIFNVIFHNKTENISLNLVSEDNKNILFFNTCKVLVNPLLINVDLCNVNSEFLNLNLNQQKSVFKIIEQKITLEILSEKIKFLNSDVNSQKPIEVLEISYSWIKLKTSFEECLENFKCEINCELNKVLKFFLQILFMIIRINIYIQRLSIQKGLYEGPLYFFKEHSILSKIMTICYLHITEHKLNLDVSLLKKILAALPLCYYARNLNVNFKFISNCNVNISLNSLLFDTEEEKKSLFNIQNKLYNYSKCNESDNLIYIGFFMDILSSGLLKWNQEDFNENTLVNFTNLYLKSICNVVVCDSFSVSLIIFLLV